MNKSAHLRHAQAELFAHAPLSVDTDNSRPTITTTSKRDGDDAIPLTIDAVASTLGVSTATIRNWVKAGFLTPISNRPLLFSAASAGVLQADIASGSLARLRSRANKTVSETTTVPREYVNCSRVIESVTRISALAKSQRLDVSEVMYVATLRWLELNGEVKRISSGCLFDFQTFGGWRRENPRRELLQWRSSITPGDQAGFDSVYDLICEGGSDDFLGLLYQSLSQEGSKSNSGSYYTPPNVVRDAVSQMASGGMFLDPCCGTGQYLVAAAKQLSVPPEKLLGFDVDHLATAIARINVLLAYRSIDFSPAISTLDTLTELATGDIFCDTNHLLGRVDCIATNPPWGAFKNSSPKGRVYCGVDSNEAFALFLAKALTLLRKGGRLSFVLPESILRIRTHAEIRELVLKTTRLTDIVSLGRLFTGVFTPVIRLDLIKGEAPADWAVSVLDEDSKRYSVPQHRFFSNQHFSFSVGVTDHDERLINKVYGVEHVTLHKRAEWALGIVTGDNARFVADTPTPDSEPVFRGSDVHHFRIGIPRAFIRFHPKQFQQVARQELYRAPEKLIYRFISDRLTFAYDDKQRLTLNSANVLIPRIPGMSMKVVLAFLNSTLFQYLFMHKFSTHKVLRGDLETLPFPIDAQPLNTSIEAIVDDLHERGSSDSRELDKIIDRLFGLSDSESQQIAESVAGR